MSDILVVLTWRIPSGGRLSTLTNFYLSRFFDLAGLILDFVMFDMSTLPFLCNITHALDVIIEEIVERSVGASFPNTNPKERCDPSLCPFHAEL